MDNNTLKQIKANLDDARKNLDELTRTISQARLAGMDTSNLETQERDLRQRISKMALAFGV